MCLVQRCPEQKSECGRYDNRAERVTQDGLIFTILKVADLCKLASNNAGKSDLLYLFSVGPSICSVGKQMFYFSFVEPNGDYSEFQNKATRARCFRQQARRGLSRKETDSG